MRPRSSSPWPPFLLLAGSVAALALLGPHRHNLLPGLLPWGSAWGALFWLWHAHGSWLDRPRVVLAGAVLLRLILFPSLPDLSDDLFRYVWDGWLSAQGIPPYRFVPADPALAHLQGSILFREMNSQGYHSIYPPLSQLVFLTGGMIHGSWGWPASALVVKTGFLVLEVCGLGLLVRTLARDGGRVRASVLYAWNPLVVLMVAGGGHTEGGLVLGLALVLAGVSTGKPLTAWTGWVLAVLSKGFPLVLAPLVWRALRGTRPGGGHRMGPLLPLGVGAGLTLVFLRPGDLAGVAASARLYVQLFEFNAGLYSALTEGVRILTGTGWGHRLGPALALLFLVGATALALRHPVRKSWEVARGILLIHSLYLVTATTVHPWYLLWVLPLLPFTGTLRGPWLWASAAAFPTYLTYAGFPHGPLTALFWGGWALLALNEFREGVLRPLRRIAAGRKARWVVPHLVGTSVVDVGGAEGALAGALAGAGVGLRPVVVDPGSHSHKPPLPVIRARGEALPLPSGGSDSVLLSFVLHHAPEPDRVLSEALRVARHRVVILESTFRWRLEGWALERLDRWINSGRADPRERRGVPIPSEPLLVHYRSEAGWRSAVEAAGGRVLTADRPNRFGHRVLRMVVEPASSSDRGAEPAVEFGAQPFEGGGSPTP